MSRSEPLHVVLEFARAENAGQPHAFRFEAQTYLLRTPGGGFESVEFPWSEALLADLHALRAAARDPDVGHRIGEVLRQFLAPAAWAAYEQKIVAATQAGAPIHVTIRSAAAELYALPWELLTLKSTGQMIGGIAGLVVRYEWPETASFPEATPTGERRGRVALAWSAAGGAVPAAEHTAILQRTRAGVFDPARDVLAHASLAGLARLLGGSRGDATPIDALCILCHGAPLGNTYGLALDDDAEPGGCVVVDAGRLQQVLAPHAGALRMVVLAACDSGNPGAPGNHLASAAQMLHRAGFRSVIASRFPLSAAGSVRLCDALFSRLSAGTSLEHAFLAAREALLHDADQLDWASIQLYERDADGDATFPLGSAGAPTPASRRSRRWWWLALGLAIAGAGIFAAWRPWTRADAPDSLAAADPGQPATTPAVDAPSPPATPPAGPVQSPDPPTDPPADVPPAKVETKEPSPSRRPPPPRTTEVTREAVLAAVMGDRSARQDLDRCKADFAGEMGRHLRRGDYPITVTRTADGRWKISVPLAKRDRYWTDFQRAIEGALTRSKVRWASGPAEVKFDATELE